MYDSSSSAGSLGPFLKGYREQTQKQRSQQQSGKASPFDIVDLFTTLGIKSMTLFEIAAHLMISKTEAAKLVEQLTSKQLVTTKEIPEGGYLVELTERGVQFTK